MLVYFFSDRNYVRAGFYAHYTITACPLNCSAHGECLYHVHRCRCYPGYTGPACDQPLCSPSCIQHGGQCSMEDFSCVCPPGRLGYDCGLSLNKSIDDDLSDLRGFWSEVVRPDAGTFALRAGHAAVTVSDCLYIFGGTTLNSLLNDLVYYCVNSSPPLLYSSASWRTVLQSSPWPAARHGHAMAAIASRWIYLFGGVIHSGDSSDELWVYDIATSCWMLLVSSLTNQQPPGLSGHTMTSVDDEYLYVIGGRTSDGQFVSDVHIAHISYSSTSSAISSDTSFSVFSSISSSNSSGVFTDNFNGTFPDTFLDILSDISSNGSTGISGSEFHDDSFSNSSSIPSSADPSISSSGCFGTFEGDSVGAIIISWRRVISDGGRSANHRLTAHSTVYHADSRSLFIYAGFSPESARFPRRSAKLLSYHVDMDRWIQLSYDTSLPAVPRERAYHTAVVIGNYMIIHGGQVNISLVISLSLVAGWHNS